MVIKYSLALHVLLFMLHVTDVLTIPVRLSGIVRDTLIFVLELLVYLTAITVYCCKQVILPVDLLNIEPKGSEVSLTFFQGMLSSVDTVQPAIQRCFHFERGRCYRGRNCKFLHSLETNHSSAEDENVGINSQSSRSVASSGTKPGNQGSSEKICRHFVRKGWCSFGQSCVFLHSGSLPADEQNVSVEASADLELFDQPLVANSEAKLECWPNRAPRGFKPKICRFYKAGYCRYGQKCKNRHVQNVSASHRAEQLEEDAELNKNTLIDAAEAAALAQREGDVGAVPEQQACAVKSCLDDVPGKPKTNVSSSKQQASPEEELCSMRKMEIQQIRRRYPKAQEVSQNGQTLVKFVFKPSDPEWVNIYFVSSIVFLWLAAWNWANKASKFTCFSN
jgi:Zinc finger C-x8-C-x5-C-x3-H type (and similar)